MPETTGTVTTSGEGKAATTQPPAKAKKIPLPLKPGGTALPDSQMVWDAAVFDRETPDYLIPKMDHFAVSTPTYFQQLLIHDPRADVTGHTSDRDRESEEVARRKGEAPKQRKQWGEEITQPIDPFVSLDEVPLPGEPIFGALVSYEQGWFEKGLALGRLLHSTCLAPGEVTKIAVTSFHRQSMGRSDESATQDDKLESATDNASAVAETQAAVSSELKTGVTSNFSLANQTQGGMAFSGILVSGNASTANNLAMGMTNAVATAATDFKAEGAKKVSQNTVAASHAVRARRASQVRETSEDESQSGQTRVIANYNHMHALTMMFFEVLQCFSLETKVIDAERVVYIPMRDMVFTEENARSYSEVLRAILIEQNLPDMVAMLDMFLAPDMASLREKEADARQNLEAFLKGKGYDPATYPGLNYPDYPALPQRIRGHEREFAYQVSLLAKNPGDTGAAGNLAKIEEFLTGARKFGSAFAAARAEILGALRIVPLLNAHRLAFNQHMWMRMDASRVQRLVYMKVVELDGKRLALDRLMDPKPIGVFGNFVAFRLPQLSNADSIAFAKSYITEPGRANGVAASIVLPSGGLFGEAVLGQAISAEKIDLTRFWNWQDSPIPILPPELSPLGMGSRARDIAFTPVEMEKAITELIKQDPALMDSPAKLAPAVAAKISESMVAGQGALQAAQVGQVGAGATAVGQLNATLQKQAQDFTISALNSKAVQSALGMAFPEGAAANAMGGAAGGKTANLAGGFLGEGKSATVMGGVMGAAKPAAGAGLGAAADKLKDVVDLEGIGSLTPIP